MAWTDERIALLKQYWDEGRSASQIAELLGEGLTRNAVIGKAHRLDLSSRPSPLKTQEAGSKPVKTAKKAAGRRAAPKAEPAETGMASVQPAETPPASAPVAPPVDTPAEDPAPPVIARPVRAPSRATKGDRVTLLDLNDRICKWPIGHPDEADFHFCGKPVSPGFPYCGEHCLLAYQAQMPRRDRPHGPSRPFGPNLPRPR